MINEIYCGRFGLYHSEVTYRSSTQQFPVSIRSSILLSSSTDSLTQNYTFCYAIQFAPIWILCFGDAYCRFACRSVGHFSVCFSACADCRFVSAWNLFHLSHKRQSLERFKLRGHEPTCSCAKPKSLYAYSAKATALQLQILSLELGEEPMRVACIWRDLSRQFNESTLQRVSSQKAL